jgi:hypothetical protein
MRAAIISQLKTISDFSNRVYQAFIPITTVETPYCTVKLSGEYPATGNRKGSTIDLQIFIYNKPDSFCTLDALELQVRKALHNVSLTIDESPVTRTFACIYNMTQADFYNDITGLFMKRVDFIIPLARA